MFDFKPVFLPVFDPCTTHSHFYFFFFHLLLHNFQFLGFSNSPQSLFLPFVLLVCLSLYINTTFVCDVFFLESPGTPGLYGQHGMPLWFPVLTGFPCKFFLKSKINVFPDPFSQAFGMVKSKLTPGFFLFLNLPLSLIDNKSHNIVKVSP